MAANVRTEVCDAFGITAVMQDEVLPLLEKQNFTVLNYEWGTSCITDDDTQFFDGFHLDEKYGLVGEMVRVEIADDGGGIPDEAKEKLFQMFYTAQHKRGGDGRRGLGLGLSLCKSIITAHGGTITVRDNLPHGTVFSFTLQAEEVNCMNKTSILVVEDDKGGPEPESPPRWRRRATTT